MRASTTPAGVSSPSWTPTTGPKRSFWPNFSAIPPRVRERSSCKAYCSTFRRPSRRGPNEAFFSYDDGALAIGDDPSAAVGQRFLQDGCSVCKLYHTETLRRLGIRFIEHLCSREDHLFFFTCISRMQSVVWRSGLYMHYMRRGRNTLSTRPMPACELVEAAERLDRFIPQLAERFGITDKAYLFALRQNLVRDTLLRAANNIRFGDRRSVLGAIAARPELFGAETYTPRWHPLLKRPLLDRILKGRECHTLLYLRIALRRSSLRLRGRFNA